MATEQVLEAYYSAMRRGSAAEHDMIALFAEDAVYDEPFSGAEEPAVGRGAILQRLRAGWEFPLPDLELEVLEVTIDGFRAETTWRCSSPALESPVLGVDTYELRDGLIARLTVRLRAT